MYIVKLEAPKSEKRTTTAMEKGRRVLAPLAITACP